MAKVCFSIADKIEEAQKEFKDPKGAHKGMLNPITYHFCDCSNSNIYRKLSSPPPLQQQNIQYLSPFSVFEMYKRVCGFKRGVAGCFCVATESLCSLRQSRFSRQENFCVQLQGKLQNISSDMPPFSFSKVHSVNEPAVLYTIPVNMSLDQRSEVTFFLQILVSACQI